jgi:hypothetical protein
LKQVAFNISFKVYFDNGFKQIEKVLPFKSSTGFDFLSKYQYWSILNTLSQSKNGRVYIRTQKPMLDPE